MEAGIVVSIYDRAVEIAEALQAFDDVPDPEVTSPIPRSWPGCSTPSEGDVFRHMDEQPGSGEFSHLRDGSSAYGRWHRYLRIAHNDGALLDRFTR